MIVIWDLIVTCHALGAFPPAHILTKDIQWVCFWLNSWNIKLSMYKDVFHNMHIAVNGNVQRYASGFHE